ncbi:MAG: ATP-dependent protease LonB [Candidatus Anstonellales archaeon]
MKYKTTEEIEVPKRIIDQVIGQDKSVEIVKKAAKQRRHILLVGPPGTGKSMLAQGMAELLPVKDLEDVLVYPNELNENEPIVRTVPTYPTKEWLQKNQQFMRYYSAQELAAIGLFSDKKDYASMATILKTGLGRRIVSVREKEEEKTNIVPYILLLLAVVGVGLFVFPMEENIRWFALALLLGFGFLYIFSSLFANIGRLPFRRDMGPKLIVDNSGNIKAPFVDGTGTKAGALLGDVKHDPLQSGGLGTPSHLRVEAGCVHKANKGVLFIDEIASLKLNWQQEILTAMQEKKYSITGQSEMSSGALVKTTPVPTDFVLIAAGNFQDLQNIHPALRSRIRGAGYEIYMETDMDDTEQNREKLVRFVAQEVVRDGRIPHFTKEAVDEIIMEARRMAGRKGKLTMNLRELGGLVRAAGDIAVEKNSRYVLPEHVISAKKVFSPVEFQIAEKIIEQKKEYQVFLNRGYATGRVNGLAVLGNSWKGILLPIVAEVTPASSKAEGKVIATGKLGKIAKEAVANVSAILKKYAGKNIATEDIHIQFLQTYEGVEGDSASVSVAVAVISASEEIPVDQSIGMTGSLDVRGEVLPVGGVSAKIEAAMDAGIKTVIVPEKNLGEIYLVEKKRKKIKVIGAKTIVDVIKYALRPCKKKDQLLKRMKKRSRL